MNDFIFLINDFCLPWRCEHPVKISAQNSQELKRYSMNLVVKIARSLQLIKPLISH
jgi:hypothetical protein